MPAVEQGFDLLPAATRLYLAIVETRLVVPRRVLIGVEREAACLAAERLLLNAIGSTDKVTARALQ